MLGSLLLGVYASSAVNPDGPDGLLFGNSDQITIQAVGVVVSLAWSGFGTWLIMLLLQYSVGARISREAESQGLDSSQHGEHSYKIIHQLL